MPITNSQAALYGLLAMYAEDMYDPQGANRLTPVFDDRIEKAGWTPRALITAEDTLSSLIKTGRYSAALSTGRVFFGFLAQNRTDPLQWAVVLRGTAGPIEWMIDAQFAPIPHPGHGEARVEHGFFGIYATMQLADLQGRKTDDRAAAGVARLVGPKGKVMITAHSLGSALATYFAQDLAELIGERASACLFASPRTGDQAWADLVDRTVKEYAVFNYVIDAVTHVPTGLGYVTLPRASRLEPETAQAGIRVGLGCNHHVICYCAMLDFARTMPHARDARDADCAKCIRGDSDADKQGAIDVQRVFALLIDEDRGGPTGKLLKNLGDKLVRQLFRRLRA